MQAIVVAPKVLFRVERQENSVLSGALCVQHYKHFTPCTRALVLLHAHKHTNFTVYDSFTKSALQNHACPYTNVFAIAFGIINSIFVNIIFDGSDRVRSSAHICTCVCVLV